METEIHRFGSLLRGKVAIVHGAGGAIGGAVARAFHDEGARLFLAGRTRARLEEIAAGLQPGGAPVELAVVDALDPVAVEAHAKAVATMTGHIDVVMNAVGLAHVQGKSFSDQTLDEFAWPIESYTRVHFTISKAASRYMLPPRSGVILGLSTPGSQLAGPGFMGYGVACAALEAMTRHLAGELGPQGIRAICLKPDAIPEALARSHSRAVFEPIAAEHSLTPEAMLAEHARSNTLLRRLPTLAQVAAAAAFYASDRAAGTTGAIVNLTCGSQLD